MHHYRMARKRAGQDDKPSRLAQMPTWMQGLAALITALVTLAGAWGVGQLRDGQSRSITISSIIPSADSTSYMIYGTVPEDQLRQFKDDEELAIYAIAKPEPGGRVASDLERPGVQGDNVWLTSDPEKPGLQGDWSAMLQVVKGQRYEIMAVAASSGGVMGEKPVLEPSLSREGPRSEYVKLKSNSQTVGP